MSETNPPDERDVLKKCIHRWVSLNNELKALNSQQREFNKKIRERKNSIVSNQNSIRVPILSLMKSEDTDVLEIGQGLNLKSAQVSVTTGLNKQYILDRVREYFDGGTFIRGVINDFIEKNHITGMDQNAIDEFATGYNADHCDSLCDYIVDISARKVYYDDEKLTLCKQKGRKKKQ